jgi:hypothetical protein
MPRVVTMRDGRIFSDERRVAGPSAEPTATPAIDSTWGPAKTDTAEP